MLKLFEKYFTRLYLSPWPMRALGWFVGVGIVYAIIFSDSHGRELMESARTTGTIAQVKLYKGAVEKFRATYKSFPGDIANALQISRCNINCNPLKDTAGDSIIGDRQFGSTLKSSRAAFSAPATSINDETLLFWQHLLLSDLVSGVTDSAIRKPTPLAWGETMPAARVGGGFVVGYADSKFPENLSPQNEGMKGTILVLKSAPDDSIALDAPKEQPVSPSRAAQIDRKLDDGKPNKGVVQAYGAPDCFEIENGNIRYAETNTQKDCGLIFKIAD
jgi:hypothetical protein